MYYRTEQKQRDITHEKLICLLQFPRQIPLSSTIALQTQQLVVIEIVFGSAKTEKNINGLQKQRARRRCYCIKRGLALCHHVHHWSPSWCSRQGRLCLFRNLPHCLCGKWIRCVFIVFWRMVNFLELFLGFWSYVELYLGFHFLEGLWWSYCLGLVGSDSIWSGVYLWYRLVFVSFWLSVFDPLFWARVNYWRMCSRKKIKTLKWGI